MADDSQSLFEQSEGTRADLKNLLGLALQRVEANIYLAQLMIWIFNTTDASKPLKKSYDELASRPWGLCCSRNQAYATVKKAERLGMIHVGVTFAGPGIQGANEYSINWDGVRQIVFPRRVGGYPTTCDPPPTTCDPPPTTCDPPPTTCDASRNNTSLHLLTPLSTSPSSEAAAGAGLVLNDDLCRQRQRTAKTKSRGSVLAGHVPPDQVLAWQATQQRLESLGVYAELCERLLVDAASRGATCDDVTALAEHFTSRPGAWTPGALTIALKRWSPGQPYDAQTLWPPPSAGFRQASNRHADARRRAAEEAAEKELRAGLERERQDAQRRDVRFGPRLDALTEEELATLVAATPRAQSSVFRDAHKQRPIGGLLRVILIDALSTNNTPD